MKFIPLIFSLAIIFAGCAGTQNGNTDGTMPEKHGATLQENEPARVAPDTDEEPAPATPYKKPEPKYASAGPDDNKEIAPVLPPSEPAPKKMHDTAPVWEPLAPERGKYNFQRELLKGEEPLVGAKPCAAASPEPVRQVVPPAESPLARVIENEENSTPPAAGERKTDSTVPPVERKLSESELFGELVRRQRHTVRENPEDMNAKLRLAELLRLAEKHVEAEQILLDVEPGGNLAVRMEKARIALELGRYKPICDELKDVLREAAPLAPLAVPVASFASDIREYARYTPVTAPCFAPGSYFQVYLELDDFVCQKPEKGDSFVTSMEVGYEIRDSANRVVFQKLHFDAWEYKTRSHLKYLFIRLTDYLPGNMLPGKYRLRVIVLDRQKPSGGKAVRDIPFNITSKGKSSLCNR